MAAAKTPGVMAVLNATDDHLQKLMHYGHSHDLRQAMSAVHDLIEAAQAAWNCIGELPPTQARVEVAQMLQAAIEKATGEAS